ncbi:flagellar assembly protein A, partial [Idiomarina abyssalis]
MSSPVSFRVSERDVYIIIDAGTRPSEVKAEQLQKAWQASDYSAAKLLDPQMMAQTATKYAQHFSKDSNSSISFQVIIAEIFDADLNLLVSDDDMKVTASAIVGFGGKPLTQEAIIAKLKEKKVTSGIQRKAIDALVEHTNEAPPGAELSVTVAKGKYPINGSNAKFKPLADDARKRVLRPQLREDGTADMRDLG